MFKLCWETFKRFGKVLNTPIHHLEDLETGSKDNPEMREQARELIDQAREIRRKVDEMRIDELAKKKLQDVS